MRDALINVGFLYLQNPPVSASVQNAFTQKGLELFRLPMEKKLEIEMVNSPHFLGYSKLGAEITALKSDHREQFDVSGAPGLRFVLRISDSLLTLLSLRPSYRRLDPMNLCTEIFADRIRYLQSTIIIIRDPFHIYEQALIYHHLSTQWPDETAIPGFRLATERYLAEVDALSTSFTALIAESLDLPSTAMNGVFDNPQQHKLKFIKYPPPPPSSLVEPSDRAGFQGVGAHKDSGFLTFLLQATPHRGLEVQNKSGGWIPAPPIPNTFVVNIGRALEALTGGVCTATTHRVSLRQEHFLDAGRSLGPRYSFPVFQGVSMDLSADNISLVVPDHIRALVKDEKVKSDAEATFNNMFKTSIGEGTLVARVTSHQDVGQRWYPDVLAKALQGQKDFVSS